MPDFTSFTTANATSTGSWSRRRRRCRFYIWTPDNPNGGGQVSGYQAPPWPVVFFLGNGGQRFAPGKLTTTSDALLMLANELSCAVFSYETDQGGWYEAGGQEPDARFWPDNLPDVARAIAWARTHHNDATLWGSGNSISRDPARSMHYGDSSDGWEVIATQLARDGDCGYASGHVTRAERRFVAQESSRCDFVYAGKPQVIFSTFNKSKVASTDPGTSYLVNGAHSSGVSSVAVNTGAGRFIKGNRVTFTGSSQQYAVTADSASPATTLAIYPTLQSGLSGGETVTRVAEVQDKYGDYAWCGGYFFRQGQGHVWQDDVELNDAAAEFPWARKRAADLDLLVTADNPRVKEVRWAFSAPGDNTIIRSTIDADQFSFLRHMPGGYSGSGLADGAIDAAHNSLHGEWQVWLLAYLLDLRGNTADVGAWAGNATSNTTVGATAWNLGLNSAFTPAAFKAWLQARSFA